MIRPGRKQTNWQPHGYQGFGFFIHGLWSGSPPDTQAGARCVNRARRDLCGVSGNGYPYRDMLALIYCFKCQRGKRYEWWRRSRSG